MDGKHLSVLQSVVSKAVQLYMPLTGLKMCSSALTFQVLVRQPVRQLITMHKNCLNFPTSLCTNIYEGLPWLTYSWGFNVFCVSMQTPQLERLGTRKRGIFDSSLQHIMVTSYSLQMPADGC